MLERHSFFFFVLLLFCARQRCIGIHRLEAFAFFHVLMDFTVSVRSPSYLSHQKTEIPLSTKSVALMVHVTWISTNMCSLSERSWSKDEQSSA